MSWSDHASARRFFRIAGPACLVIGGYLWFSIMTGVRFGSGPDGMMRAFGEFTAGAFLGFVFLAAGAFMTKLGFVGAFTTYAARETRPAVALGAGAVGEGFAAGLATPSGGTCVSCGAPNRAGARHCGHCGAPVGGVACPACGAGNAAGHRHCDRCGAALAR